MATNTDVSTPTTGDDAIFSLKTQAVLAGWVVQASGDGVLAYSANGDIITTSASLGTIGAWFRLRMPGATTREFLFTRKATSTAWTVKYTPAGFLTGSPSATNSPTGANSQTLIDGTLLDTDATYRWCLSFNTSAPYDVWAAAFTIGPLTAVTAFFCLSMETGSYASGDLDPYALMAVGPAGSPYNQAQLYQASNLYSVARGWYRYAANGSGTWRTLSFATPWIGQGNIYTEATLAGLGLTDSVSGQEYPLDIVTGFRQGANQSLKGRLSWGKWCSTSTATYPNGSQLTDGNGGYWLRANSMWLRWDSSVPSL